MHKCSVFLGAILLIAFVANSQNKELEELSRANYIERFPEYYFIWPVLKQRSTSFSLSSVPTNQKLIYKPNVRYHAGLGFYIFEVGVQVVLAIPSTDASNREFGKSNALDLQANIIGKTFGIDIFSQNYRGYYFSDPAHPIPNGTPKPQRTDVVTWNNGATGILFFNKRFSIRSTFNYYERQLKSVGSFVVSGTANTFSLRADSSIFSKSYESSFGSAGNFQKMDYSSIGFGPGYAYNFIVKKTWFLGASFSIGPSLNWINYKTLAAPWKSSVEVKTYTDLRISAGYNGERFFAGVSYIRQAWDEKYENIQFTSANDAIKLAIGYRFREVGILKIRAADYLKPKSR